MSNTEDISRVGQSLEGMPINNTTTIISTIGNHSELGEILEDLRLAPYESWAEMDQYENYGFRELFIQWAIGKNRPFLFALSDKRRPIVRIFHSAKKYAGKFGAEDHHAGEVVVFVRECTERKEPTLVLIQPGKLTTPQKETMASNENMDTWEYY